MKRDSSNFAKDRYFSGHSGSRSVQENFNLLTSFIQEAVHKYIPSKTNRSTASVPWITSEIRRIIRKRNRTLAKAKKTGSSKLRSKFQALRQQSKLISRNSMICMLTNWLVTLRLTPKTSIGIPTVRGKTIRVSLLSKGEMVVVWLSLKLSKLRISVVSLQMYSPKLRKVRSLYLRSQLRLCGFRKYKDYSRLTPSERFFSFNTCRQIHLFQYLQTDSSLPFPSDRFVSFDSFRKILLFQYLQKDSSLSISSERLFSFNSFRQIVLFQYLQTDSSLSIHSDRFFSFNTFRQVHLFQCLQTDSSLSLHSDTFHAFRQILLFQYVRTDSSLTIPSNRSFSFNAFRQIFLFQYLQIDSSLSI